MKINSRKSLERMTNKELLSTAKKMARELDVDWNANESILNGALERQFVDVCKLLESRGYVVSTKKILRTVLTLNKK
jgi:hypothetical protein